MEIWDAYDRDFIRIEGRTLIRGEKLPDGMYHLVSDILVRHADGDYLLMQRDRRKPFGGMWEATAGGSALQGEDAVSCASRELFEETGIAADTMTEVGRVVSDETQSLYVEFLCTTDCRKDSIILQDGETAAYRWVTKEMLVSMNPEELLTERIQKFLKELQPSDNRVSMNPSLLSSQYSVCRMAQDQIPEIYALCSKNLLYYRYCPPFVTESRIASDMKALPPNKEAVDKYYLGFYKGGQLIAVMDLILGFPNAVTAFVGFFMTNVSVQNKGVGSRIVQELCDYMRLIGFTAIRLGWVKGNPQSEHFWHKNLFRETGVTYDTEGYTVIVAERLLAP